MFLVVKGRFRMEFLDRHEWIEEGEFIVVPRQAWSTVRSPTKNAGYSCLSRLPHEYRQSGQRAHRGSVGASLGTRDET